MFIYCDLVSFVSTHDQCCCIPRCLYDDLIDIFYCSLWW